MAWGVVIAINLLLIALTLLAAYKSALLGSVPGLTRLNDIMADTGGATLSGALSTPFCLFGVAMSLLFLHSCRSPAMTQSRQLVRQAAV